MHRLSSAEYQEWLAFYGIDPWGEQRSDLRMAKLMGAVLEPHLRPGVQVDLNDFLPYPDAAHDLPDDVDETERKWMLKLSRAG